MAKCAICNKSVQFGHKVSHSNRKANKMWKPNIRRVKVKTGPTSAKRIYICANCLRSGKVERA